MPPYPWCFDGLDQLAQLLERTTANRMPTAASYLRRHGDSEFRAFKFDVLRVEGDQIAEITTFGPELFDQFGLPLVLPRGQV